MLVANGTSATAVETRTPAGARTAAGAAAGAATAGEQRERDGGGTRPHQRVCDVGRIRTSLIETLRRLAERVDDRAGDVVGLQRRDALEALGHHLQDLGAVVAGQLGGHGAGLDDRHADARRR